MSDIIDKVNDQAKEQEKEKEMGYKEIKELINNSKSAENPLRELAKEINRIKEEEGYKGTSMTYPASWEPLMKELKDLGERETGFSNMSLMINIAVIELLLRHKSNPQPKLADSIGLTIPSTIESNFSEEFKNYLRNLPRDRAEQVMLKNAKYLALGVTVEEEQQKKEQREELEQQTKEIDELNQQVEQQAEEWKQEKKQEIMRKLDKAEQLKEVGKDREAEEIIDSITHREIEGVRERIREVKEVGG